VWEQALCDALWSDEDGDAARNAFAITVLRLRKLLGANETVLQRGGSVSLNPDLCWVDAQMFEVRIVDKQSTCWDALSLYGGTFLAEDEDEPWSVAARERLRGRFIHALSMHGAALEAQGDAEGALECYLRGIDADPIVESFYLGLMRCYDRLGRHTEALSAYRRLKQTLSVLLGVPPSDAAQRLFQTMLASQAEGTVMETGPHEGADTNPASAGSRGRRAVVTRLRARNNRAE
jgi:DNA-binding SARP family transcriptional activator